MTRILFWNQIKGGSFSSVKDLQPLLGYFASRGDVVGFKQFLRKCSMQRLASWGCVSFRKDSDAQSVLESGTVVIDDRHFSVREALVKPELEKNFFRVNHPTTYPMAREIVASFRGFK